MRVLIAEDDAVSRTFLAATLRKWDYDVSTFPDGSLAWQELERGEAPDLLILDWMMPGLDGLEVCRRLRQKFPALPVYIILLTARTGRADVVQGLLAGANDYITKPFDREELRARVQVGRRVIELQKALAGRVGELEHALEHIQQLQGLLPICSYCKRVRNDRNYWQQIETYVSEHSEAQFSHGICPDCWEKVVKPELEREKLKGGGNYEGLGSASKPEYLSVGLQYPSHHRLDRLRPAGRPGTLPGGRNGWLYSQARPRRGIVLSSRGPVGVCGGRSSRGTGRPKRPGKKR